MNGILVIDKPSNCTSRDIVNIISRKFKTKKVGHTGTLDPIATGILVLCLGNSLKICELLTADIKEYYTDVIIGYETDMLDITGTKVKEKPIDITTNQVKEVLNSFLGETLQQVPKYSAVKINGKKLYEYARSNIDIELPTRKVNIQEIELLSDVVKVGAYYEFKMRCVVSKGTYIRALIRDIGYKLGSYGTMKSLRRTRQGKFNLTMANTIEDINSDNYKLYSIKDSLDIKTITVDDKLAFKIKNGVSLKKELPYNLVLFVDRRSRELAIYKKEVINKQTIMKAWKVFPNT